MSFIRILLTFNLTIILYTAQAQVKHQSVVYKTIHPLTFMYLTNPNYGFKLDLIGFKNQHGQPTNNDQVEVKMFTSLIEFKCVLLLC
jgi:ABC-type uncharacterized transport system permease subunit